MIFTLLKKSVVKNHVDADDDDDDNNNNILAIDMNRCENSEG